MQLISNENLIADTDFRKAVQLLHKLERDKCSDYIGLKAGEEYVKDTRTHLFAGVCIKRNDLVAVKEYIKYLKRQQGLAEEQLSFSFEELFNHQPELVLSEINNNHDLLDQLVWGFVNNHWKQVSRKNYKKVFFQLNPTLKPAYSKYKSSIDYLLEAIYAELK